MTRAVAFFFGFFLVGSAALASPRSSVVQDPPHAPQQEGGTTPPIAPPAPSQDAIDTLKTLQRKTKIAQRRAKIFKIGSVVLSSAGLLGGVGSALTPKLIDDPDLQAQIGQIGALASGVSSGLGLLFNFEKKAGKNKDCLAYLTQSTVDFQAKWSMGVPSEKSAEYAADKEKIANGSGGKCRKLSLP